MIGLHEVVEYVVQHKAEIDRLNAQLKASNDARAKDAKDLAAAHEALALAKDDARAAREELAAMRRAGARNAEIDADYADPMRADAGPGNFRLPSGGTA